MTYTSLSATGVQVGRLALGTQMMASSGNSDQDECRRIVDTALDAGINIADTGDVYSVGGSEEIVGRALAGKRDGIFLAAKCGGPMNDAPNECGNNRRWIMSACENSLHRLRTDWIGLYQIYRYTPETRLDETLGALTDLVRRGKVRYLGTSTFPAHVIVEAQHIDGERNLERFVCEQPPYSGASQGDADHGVSFAVLRWRRSSLGLGKPYDMSSPENQRKLEICDEPPRPQRAERHLGHRTCPGVSATAFRGDDVPDWPAHDAAPGISANGCRYRPQ